MGRKDKENCRSTEPFASPKRKSGDARCGVGGLGRVGWRKGSLGRLKPSFGAQIWEKWKRDGKGGACGLRRYAYEGGAELGLGRYRAEGAGRGRSIAEY